MASRGYELARPGPRLARGPAVGKAADRSHRDDLGCPGWMHRRFRRRSTSPTTSSSIDSTKGSATRSRCGSAIAAGPTTRWPKIAQDGGAPRRARRARGERVLIVLPDVPPFAWVFFGTLARGAVVAMGNPHVPVENLEYLVEYTRATAIVTVPEGAPSAARDRRATRQRSARAVRRARRRRPARIPSSRALADGTRRAGAASCAR